MSSRTRKILALTIGGIVSALGLTVLKGTDWGLFAAMSGSIIGGMFGYDHKPGAGK